MLDEADTAIALALPSPAAHVSAWAKLKNKVPRERPSLVWWHELLIIALGYLFYTIIRNGVPAREGVAFLRAIDVVKAEQTLRIFHELAINKTVAAHQHIAQVMNYYYATAHFIVTIWVGVWLFVRQQMYARALRTAWYLTNVVALFGYAFFPLAPPRLLSDQGFVDTVVVFHTWGSWGSDSVSSASNQFAAMPSMHIGWSLWCGVVIYKLAQRRWVRALGVIYPILTLAVIVGTANHYFLDALGGGMALAVGFCLARLLNGRWAFTPDPRVAEQRVKRKSSPPPRGPLAA